MTPKTFLFLSLTIIGVLLWLFFGGNISTQYPEVAELSEQDATFDEYTEYFEALAEERGAEYAFEVLRRAQLTPGTDLHLLAHVVGDILYKQEGIDGIHTCTPDFRNACSHSVVVGLFSERGIEALDDIAQACNEAPGGSGAYTMCFHGLGHGILAYANYDFEQAMSLCEKTGTPVRNHREYIECVGGMTMEMISGVHDRNAWELARDDYFNEDNPLAPCNLPFVPEETRPICYTYLTPHLFQVVGGNLGNPTTDIYEKAFSLCDRISEEEQQARDACYGGFGKEFVVLAEGRDVRDIGSSGEDTLRQVRYWCSLADDERGEIVCNGTALSSLFWGGENIPDASFLFCEIEDDQKLQTICYQDLTQMILFFLADSRHVEELCRRLPEPHRNFCISNIKT